MSSPLVVLATLASVLCACGAGHESSPEPSPVSAPPESNETDASGGRIAITVRGFRNRDGQALVSLFAGARGFPDKGEQSMRREAYPVDADELHVVFRDVSAGTYAVAVLHDEDMDFKMKTGTFGIPKEGYGVSNNARGRFGPPKYKDAKFVVATGADVALTIDLEYH